MALREDITLRRFSSQVQSLARPNRFIVNIKDRYSPDLDSFKFFITKAVIPQVDITGPELNYFGTKITLSGDPKFEPLVLSFLNGKISDKQFRFRIRCYKYI